MDRKFGLWILAIAWSSCDHAQATFPLWVSASSAGHTEVEIQEH